MLRLVPLGILALVLLLHAWPGGQAQQTLSPNPHDVLRFHVVANSDAPADQAVKLAVRNALLPVIDSPLASATSLSQAIARVRQLEPTLERIAQQQVARFGRSYAVHLQLGRGLFPTKTYGQFTLPAGSYTAFEVVLGRGHGQNWWCVLFPPLCLLDPSSAEAVTEAPSPQVPVHLKPSALGHGSVAVPRQQVTIRFGLALLWQRVQSLFR